MLFQNYSDTIERTFLDFISVVFRKQYRKYSKCWTRSDQAKVQTLFGMLAENLLGNHVENNLGCFSIISKT